LVHSVVSEKPKSKVEQPVLEEDQSERYESKFFVLTKEQLEQVIQIAPFLNRTILIEGDIKSILDFWQLNLHHNPFLHN
jgi:hypothetical protein